MKKLLLIFAAFTFTCVAYSQLYYYKAPFIPIEKKDKGESFWDKNFKPGLGAGMSASTNGLGVNLKGKFNEKLGMRVAYEFLDIAGPKTDMNKGDLAYNVSPDVTTGGFSFLLDYTFFKSFYVSGGIVRPHFEPTALLAPTNSLRFGDIVLTPDQIGTLELKMKPKNTLAPSLSLGYNHSMLKSKRLNLNVEAGTYYINSMKADITGTNLLQVNNNPENKTLDKFNDELNSMNWTKFYPVLRVGVSYNIF